MTNPLQVVIDIGGSKILALAIDRDIHERTQLLTELAD
jgi:hypothetical protein